MIQINAGDCKDDFGEKILGYTSPADTWLSPAPASPMEQVKPVDEDLGEGTLILIFSKKMRKFEISD